MHRSHTLLDPSSSSHPRRWLAAGCLALTTIVSLPAASAAATPIRVGIIGDQTGSDDLDRSYSVLRDGVSRLRTQPPNVVLHTGDLVESSQSPEQITARFRSGVSILAGLGVPWYLTAGDHDVNPTVWQPNSPDRSRETLFRSLYAKINPAVQTRLYYSFDVTASSGEIYHFISLYALEHLDTDPRWGDVFWAQLSAAQQQWLHHDLDTHAGATAIIVWLHQPLWYNWSSWAPVHRLLSDYPVVAVIAGHFHYNQSEGVINGIDYRVVGATGGSLAGTSKVLPTNASPWAGGAQHVTVMTINGRQVSYELLSLSGDEPKDFTPRYDMDRVQAISYAQSNLLDFWSANPIWLSPDGKPVSSCTSMTPALLNLRQFGNPLDVPIRFKVILSSDVVSLASAKYNTTVCSPDSPPGACWLAANANVSLSNTSTVELNSYSPVDIWQATLASTGSSHGQATLTVSSSYVSPFSNLPLGMSASVVTSVAKCPSVEQVPREHANELADSLKQQQQWLPLGAARSRSQTAATVEIGGGHGLGRIAVSPSDIKTEGSHQLLRVGAKVKILETPKGVAPKRGALPRGTGTQACQHLMCIPAVPHDPVGILICCDTGEVLGRCTGMWPCTNTP
jgi:hypothetical protein